MDKLYILDASGYLYRSYFAIRNMTNAFGESTNALFGFTRSLQKLCNDFRPHHLVAVFDGPRSGLKRTEIYSQYKAHRAATPPDLIYQIGWAQQLCYLLGIPILIEPGVEADDLMASVAVWARKLGVTSYICTSDKDLGQVVNEHIFILNTFKDNLVMGPKEVEDTYGVPPHQMVDWLSITGDSSDNIPGIKGFGAKTAASLLKEFGSLDALLAHPEKVSGKKQETIREQTDQALLSRKLVTLDTEVDFPKDASFFLIKSPQIKPLKEFYSKMSFHSLLRELEGKESETGPQAIQEDVTYNLADDEDSFQQLLTLLAQQKEVCVDTETTNVLPLRAELVGVGFCFEPKQAWYVPLNGSLGAQNVLSGIKPLLENPSIGFYGHNMKYELHVFANYGIKIKNIAFDTIIASYLLNSHSRQHSLDHLALEYFGKVKIPITNLIGKGKKQVSMKEVPINDVCAYCCEDVDYTCRIKLVLEKQIQERNLSKLFHEVELPLTRVLEGMEHRGIYVNVPYLENMSHEIATDLFRLSQDIYLLAGEEFNINSPKQLASILFTKLNIRPPKKTATGLSTDAEVLETLSVTYPIAKLILDYRSLEKLRSTYTDTLPTQVDPKTNRIHCTFNQSVAATGRLSCQDPNLQNIPIRTEFGRKIRTAFCPQKEGWSFISADYSQIELRLLAHFSEDTDLIAAFHQGEDIHAHTAAYIFGIPKEIVSSEQRNAAKTVNFGIVYGQQAFGLAQQLKIDFRSASQFIDLYFKRFPHVKEYIERCKEETRKTGKAVTLWGRERLIPEIHSKNNQLRSAAERLAVNTPLQGTAADLIKVAMVEMDNQMRKKQLHAHMILQIHDELIFEVPENELSTMQNLIRKVMEGVIPLRVPLVVNIAIGKNWGEC